MVLSGPQIRGPRNEPVLPLQRRQQSKPHSLVPSGSAGPGDHSDAKVTEREGGESFLFRGPELPERPAWARRASSHRTRRKSAGSNWCMALEAIAVAVLYCCTGPKTWDQIFELCY
jgi:hypothetical protein